MTPNFSAYPWQRIPRLSRAEAALQSLVARWIGARSSSVERLSKLVRAEDVVVRVGSSASSRDPYAACAIVRVGGVVASGSSGASIEVWGSAAGVRALSQRLLGGPDELHAPRPLGVVEQSMWCLVVATALEDLGVAGEVWPQLGSSTPTIPTSIATSASTRIALDVRLADTPLTVELVVPSDLALRVPPRRPAPAWTEATTIDAVVVLGRCALHRDDLARLAPRQIITLDAPTSGTSTSRASTSGTASEKSRWGTSMIAADLDLLGGTLGIRGEPGAVSARVVTGYVRRDMSMPDDAHVELTVALGTTQLSLRQVVDLAVGQIVPLGRPLAGPFEVRAQGRVVGRGELVDVDGELAVRIVSLGD